MKYLILASCVALLPGIAAADVLTSGTATRVGEPLEGDSTYGRSQVKVCGKIEGFNPPDLSKCTFQSAGDSPLEYVDQGTTGNTMKAKKGSSANSATFENGGRPSIQAKLTDHNNGIIDFCIAYDRMITIAPDGISTEPCVDGDTTQLLTEFHLDCGADGDHEFAQVDTWRVANHCNGTAFPNLRLFK